MMRRRRKCRLWWPSNISAQTQNPTSSFFLFGWCISSSESSIDVVVAFASDQPKLSSSIESDLKEILQRTNNNMPTLLHEKCNFSLLGYYEADCSGNGQLVRFGKKQKKRIKFTSDRYQLNTCTSTQRCQSCGCLKLDSLFEQGRLSTLGSMWIKLVYGLSESTGRSSYRIPKLDHIHWNGEAVFQLDLHVVVYEIPSFGGHHYSPGIQYLSNLGTSCKTPKWFDDLLQKDVLLDLNTVVRAMNSANAAQALFNRNFHAESDRQFHIVCMFTTFLWELFAVYVASLSTVIYIILQLFHNLFSWVSQSCIFFIPTKVFSNTWQNIHVRCCQLLYWPIFLRDHSLRSWSCVEFAEKAASEKHSMWSNVVVDVLLGTFFGIALWSVAEPFCLWVSNFALDITNYWFRTGCVWLMGNPAGFKVNSELAGVLGMISLTGIQIWSTLWAYTGFLLIYITKGLALCGILFGLTAAAALVIDIISLATMHILTLHLFLSLLYSTQIQAVAALWRLFRGKKWNPLRHRLDSYDYTVEQHVVGSLLFTPIILLLPTTSAYYVFFTILRTAVCFICIIIEVAISFIHATPYAKVLLWLKCKKRFPSGIWFEVTSCRHFESRAATSNNSSPGKLQKNAYAGSNEPTMLVSFLHSNYLSLGEVLWPHYRYFFSAFSMSSIGSTAYGLLSGKSIPCSLGAKLPPTLPWIEIPWKEYWHLCHNSIYACRGNRIHVCISDKVTGLI